MRSFPTVKDKVIKGGVYLVFRQVLAAIFSLISTLVIARILGPESYGIVATSLGIFYFLKWAGRLGVHIYLVRKPDLSTEEIEQGLSFYNTVGITFCILLWCASPIFGWWTQQQEVTSVLRWLIPAIWFDMIAGLYIAMLERELRFDRVGLYDALAQIVNYSFSVPFVLFQKNYWGPVIGTILQFFVLACLSYSSYSIAWRWRWQRKTLKPILLYGLTYYSSNWIFTLKSLTVPLFVTRFAGVEAAGLISIAVRMVQQLSLLRVVVQRMSISVMAKVMEDANTTRRTISKGMTYQALLMSLICGTFSCFASWIVPLVFGEKWLPSSQIFPLIGLAATVSAIFDLHNATLYAAGKNYEVGRLNFAYVGLLWLSSWLMIPRFGYWGYGIAQIMALPSYYLIHLSLSKFCGCPSYWGAFWFILAAIPAIIGSIWLPIWSSFAILFLCYGTLILFNSKIRKVPLELLTAFNNR